MSFVSCEDDAGSTVIEKTTYISALKTLPGDPNSYDIENKNFANVGNISAVTQTISNTVNYNDTHITLNSNLTSLVGSSSGMFIGRGNALPKYQVGFFEDDDSVRIGEATLEQHLMTRNPSNIMIMDKLIKWDGTGFKSVSSAYSDSDIQGLLTNASTTSNSTFNTLTLNGGDSIIKNGAGNQLRTYFNGGLLVNDNSLCNGFAYTNEVTFWDSLVVQSPGIAFKPCILVDGVDNATGGGRDAFIAFNLSLNQYRIGLDKNDEKTFRIQDIADTANVMDMLAIHHDTTAVKHIVTLNGAFDSTVPNGLQVNQGNIRLNYATDSLVYTDISTDASGSLNIAPTGSFINVSKPIYHLAGSGGDVSQAGLVLFDTTNPPAGIDWTGVNLRGGGGFNIRSFEGAGTKSYGFSGGTVSSINSTDGSITWTGNSGLTVSANCTIDQNLSTSAQVKHNNLTVSDVGLATGGAVYFGNTNHALFRTGNNLFLQTNSGTISLTTTGTGGSISLNPGGSGTVDILQSTNEQLRLSYDNVTNTKLQTDSTGNLTITPSGANPSILLPGNTHLTVNGSAVPTGLARAEIIDAGNQQLRLSYNVTNYTDFKVNVNGDLEVIPIRNMLINKPVYTNFISSVTSAVSVTLSTMNLRGSITIRTSQTGAVVDYLPLVNTIFTDILVAIGQSMEIHFINDGMFTQEIQQAVADPDFINWFAELKAVGKIVLLADQRISITLYRATNTLMYIMPI